MSNEAMKLAYEAAYRAVGLTGQERHACARYRSAVDAALEVLKPVIAAEALRKAADEIDGWAAQVFLENRADEIERGEVRL